MGQVFEYKGQPLILADAVAEIFEMETRAITQNLRRNPKKFDDFSDRYAFQLSKKDVEVLRSLEVIPKPGRGGSRALPWALTYKGVLRLATIVDSPKGIEIVDLMIDVFAETVPQLTNNDAQGMLDAPGQAELREEIESAANFRKILRQRLADLMDTMIDKKEQITVSQALETTAANAFKEAQALLKRNQRKDDHMAAETAEIVERIRDMAERRISELKTAAQERELTQIKIVKEKISALEQMIEVSKRLEPNAMVQVQQMFQPRLEAFETD